jgi:uncharacterized SAM-dependent methyltransferase
MALLARTGAVGAKLFDRICELPESRPVPR